MLTLSLMLQFAQRFNEVYFQAFFSELINESYLHLDLEGANASEDKK